MRLLQVEVRRLLGRRMVVLLALVGLVGAVLVLVGAWFSARPLSEAQIAEAQRQYEWALEDWEKNGDEMLASCLEEEERESERTGEDVDFGCEQMKPQEEWFIPQSTELGQTFEPLLASAALLPVFLAFAVGATSTGAEVSSGSLSTWLTFVPQRMRVLFSKVGAGGVVGLPFVAGLIALLVGGVYGVHAVNGALGGLDAAVWSDVGWMALRVIGLGAFVAACGASLGVLFKHTGAVLGVVVGYAVVVDGILGALVPRLQPYLLRTNLSAWVEGGTIYWVDVCTVGPDGTICEGVERTVSQGHGALVLAVVTVVVLGVTALVFRRRDVG